MTIYKFLLRDVASPGGAGDSGKESGTSGNVAQVLIQYDSRVLPTSLAKSAFASFISTVEAG